MLARAPMSSIYSLRPFLVVHFRNDTQIKATIISTVKLQFYPYDNFSLQNYNHLFELKWNKLEGNNIHFYNFQEV